VIILKVKEISVEASFTKNLGNYQSVKFMAGSIASVEDNDNIKDCYLQMWDMCGDQINEQLKLFDDKKK
jgi:hypothetical protein